MSKCNRNTSSNKTNARSQTCWSDRNENEYSDQTTNNEKCRPTANERKAGKLINEDYQLAMRCKRDLQTLKPAKYQLSTNSKISLICVLDSAKQKGSPANKMVKQQDPLDVIELGAALAETLDGYNELEKEFDNTRNHFFSEYNQVRRDFQEKLIKELQSGALDLMERVR